jgi:hypothetical protein
MVVAGGVEVGVAVGDGDTDGVVSISRKII